MPHHLRVTIVLMLSCAFLSPIGLAQEQGAQEQSGQSQPQDSSQAKTPDTAWRTLEHIPSDATNVLILRDPLPVLRDVLASPITARVLAGIPGGSFSLLRAELSAALAGAEKYFPSEIAVGAPDATLRDVAGLIQLLLALNIGITAGEAAADGQNVDNAQAFEEVSRSVEGLGPFRLTVALRFENEEVSRELLESFGVFLSGLEEYGLEVRQTNDTGSVAINLGTIAADFDLLSTMGALGMLTDVTKLAQERLMRRLDSTALALTLRADGNTVVFSLGPAQAPSDEASSEPTDSDPVDSEAIDSQQRDWGELWTTEPRPLVYGRIEYRPLREGYNEIWQLWEKWQGTRVGKLVLQDDSEDFIGTLRYWRGVLQDGAARKSLRMDLEPTPRAIVRAEGAALAPPLRSSPLRRLVPTDVEYASLTTAESLPEWVLAIIMDLEERLSSRELRESIRGDDETFKDITEYYYAKGDRLRDLLQHQMLSVFERGFATIASAGASSTIGWKRELGPPIRLEGVELPRVAVIARVSDVAKADTYWVEVLRAVAKLSGVEGWKDLDVTEPLALGEGLPVAQRLLLVEAASNSKLEIEGDLQLHYFFVDEHFVLSTSPELSKKICVGREEREYPLPDLGGVEGALSTVSNSPFPLVSSALHQISRRMVFAESAALRELATTVRWLSDTCGIITDFSTQSVDTQSYRETTYRVEVGPIPKRAPLPKPKDPREEQRQLARATAKAGEFAEAEAILDSLWQPGRTDRFLERVQSSRAEVRLSQLNIQGAYDDCFGYYGASLDFQRRSHFTRGPRTIRGICHDVAGDPDKAVEEFVFSNRPGQLSRHYGRLFATVLTGKTALLPPLLEADGWVSELARFLDGQISADELIASAEQSRANDNEESLPRRLCEAHLLIGRDADRRGDVQLAESHYKAAVATEMNNDYEVMWARARLAKSAGRLAPLVETHSDQALRGYVSLDGQVAITPRFQYAHLFEDGIAHVTVRDCRQGDGAIDREGNFVIPPVYDQVYRFASCSVARVRRDDKFGFVDREGTLVIPLKYEEAGNFTDTNVAWAVDPESGLYGYLAPDGLWKLSPQFESATDFHEGYASVKEDDWWHVIDEGGRRVGTIRSTDAISFSDGLARVRLSEGGPIGFQELDGSWRIQPTFSYAAKFRHGRAAVRSPAVARGELWYFIDTQGETVGEHRFGRYYDFDEWGLAEVEYQGTWGVIDTSGSFVVDPVYERAYGGTDGITTVHKDGRQAFVDRNGKLIADRWFYEVEHFNDGAGVALTESGWGVLNEDGEWLIPPGGADSNRAGDGLIAVEMQASDAAWKPLDPAEFPESVRPWIELNSKEQRFADIFHAMESHVARLAVEVGATDFSDPDQDHSLKRALFDRVHELLVAEQLATFWDECLSGQGRAFRASPGLFSFDLKSLPGPVVEEFLGRLPEIEESRDRVLRYQLSAGANPANLATDDQFLQLETLLAAVPSFAEQRRNAYAEVTDAEELASVAEYFRDQMQGEIQVEYSGTAARISPPKGADEKWYVILEWQNGRWLLKMATIDWGRRL